MYELGEGLWAAHTTGLAPHPAWLMKFAAGYSIRPASEGSSTYPSAEIQICQLSQTLNLWLEFLLKALF